MNEALTCITRWLTLLGHTEAGGVIEVCTFRGGKPESIGYFDDVALAAKTIAAHNGGGNLFVTVNPAIRALCGRAYNKLLRVEKRTKDDEITCLRWLFLDFDPARPSDVSSTDGELAAATAAAKLAKEILLSVGVPVESMVTAMSGNGCYLLVRLPDYSIDQKTRTQAIVNYIADLCETPQVKFDRGVFNPARLIGAVGAEKKKGDPSFRERPHRVSRIYSIAGEPFDPAIDQRPTPCDVLAILEPLLPTPEPARQKTKAKSGQAESLYTSGGFDIRDHTGKLNNQKPTDRGWSYYDCPNCDGDQTLFVNDNNGAYSCWHVHAGTCIFDDLRIRLREIAGVEGRPFQNGHSVHDSTKPEPWDLPVSFREFDLPAFPLEALSSWQRSYVEQLAEATQTPADLAAMQSLSAIAATIARNVEIEARQGWREPLCIFTLTVAESANRKSAVVSEITRPLERFEGDLLAEMREKIAEAVNERRILEARLEKAQKDCAKLDGAELANRKADAREIAIEIENHVIPVAPRFFVDDTTSEALASKMAEQGGRIALFSAEGGIFETMAGRYSNGTPNIDVYLKGHAGDSLRVDRRQRSERIERPALTIGLAVQSDVIRGLAQKPGFRGRGLLGRFLYSLPPSRLGSRKSRAKSISTEAAHTYERYLIRLAAIKPPELEDGEPEPILLRLSAEADDYLAQFQDEIEPELAEGGEYATISEWAGKLCGAAVRLAGILHCADHAMNAPRIPGEVIASTFKRAVEIARYLIPHSLAAHAEMGADPLVEDARYVLRWLIREQLNEVTKRDVHRGCRRFKKITELDPVLTLLEDHNYLRPLLPPLLPPTGDGAPRLGRKASSLYAVNPALHLAGQKGQKGQNPVKNAGGAAGENGNYLGGQKGQKGQNTPKMGNSVLSVLSVPQADEWNFEPEPGGEPAEIVPPVLPAVPPTTPAKRRVSL